VLDATVAARAAAGAASGASADAPPPRPSYTARHLADRNHRLKKIGAAAPARRHQPGFCVRLGLACSAEVGIGRRVERPDANRAKSGSRCGAV
jgi:hypothetical protein